MNLQCPEGQLLNVLSANYGRTSGSVCIDSNVTSWDNCITPDVQMADNFYTQCHAQNSCSVLATTANFGGDDPCPSATTNPNYLEATYYCVPKDDISFAQPTTRAALMMLATRHRS